MPTPQPAEHSYASLNGQPIISAASALLAFEENGWDSSAWIGKANSFHCPAGEEIGTGWVLMFRSRLNELTSTYTNAVPIPLTFGQGASDESIEIWGLYIRSAQRVSPGQSQSDDAVYLVELVDTRYQLARKPVNKRYNCRQLRQTTDDYVEETLNSGTPWTWSEVITDLWSENIALIGSIGTLPDLSDITSTPENLRYEGVSAWSALNDACRRCGCQVIHDNAFVINFYVVRLGVITGESDPEMFGDGGTTVTKESIEASISSGHTTRPVGGGDGLVVDDEIMQGDAMMPRYITVHFPTEYGEDQITDELRSPFGKWYPVMLDGTDSATDMPTSIACDFHDATGDAARIPRPDFNPYSQLLRYESMPARFSALPTLTTDLPSNHAALKIRAQEIARDVYRTMHDLSFAHLRYMGIHFGGDANVVIPGKCISAVTWSDLGNGFQTDLWREIPFLLPDIPVMPQQPGGDTLVPIVITTVDGSGDPVAVASRITSSGPVIGKIVDLGATWICPGYGIDWRGVTGDDVNVSLCDLPGYLVTGDVVMCRRSRSDGYYWAVAGPTRNHFLAPVLSMSGSSGTINLNYHGQDIVQSATSLMCCTPTPGDVSTGDLVTGFYNEVVGVFFITHNLTSYCCPGTTTPPPTTTTTPAPTTTTTTGVPTTTTTGIPTTTTTGGPTTTTVPPGSTTTPAPTTTAAPTTTTTNAPCTGLCEYDCVHGQYVQATTTCSSGCDCSQYSLAGQPCFPDSTGYPYAGQAACS